MGNGTNNTHIYVAKLDAEGTALWSHSFGNSLSQMMYAVAVDPAGSVYLGGQLWGTVNFGGTALTGSGAAYVAKFDTFGAHVWSRMIGTSSLIKALAIGAGGDVYASGTFTGTLDFGTPELPQPGAGRDIFMVQLNSAGTYLWGQAFGSAFDDDVKAMAVGTGNEPVLTFEGIGDISLGDQVFPASRRGLVKLSAERQYAWIKDLGEVQAFSVVDIAIDPTSREAVLVGAQLLENDYGLGPMVSAGSSDALVVKLAP